VNARFTTSPCYCTCVQLCVGGALQHQHRARSSSLAPAQFLFKGELVVQFPLTDTSFPAQTVLKSSVQLYFLETSALINARQVSQSPAWFCSSTKMINPHQMGSSRVCLALISVLLNPSRSKQLTCHFWSERPDKSSQVPQASHKRRTSAP